MGVGRVAVFVDAGYLFAQGTTALCGSKQLRQHTELDPVAAVEEFSQHAIQISGGASLLRIYWYDGARQATGLTQDHVALAFCNNIKLRLGFVNSHGQQKGVDSLIVTDLIELARNGAIHDAVLLSGDEDVRIGVQIAQSFGVRVHLLGIEPQRGSQSQQLIQEADTTSEWSKEQVGKFVSVRMPLLAGDERGLPAAATTNESQRLLAVVKQVGGELTRDQIGKLVEGWIGSPTIPGDLDGRLLGKAGETLNRPLSNPEKSELRKHFRDHVKELHRMQPGSG